MTPGTFIDQMTAWRLLKHRYMNFYDLHGFPASWQQWSGLGQMTGGSVQECNCMVHSPGPGLCYPQDSSEVTWLFFYLDSLWGLCYWSSSANSLFSLVKEWAEITCLVTHPYKLHCPFLTYCWCSQSATVVLDTSCSQIWTFLIFKRLICSLTIYFY